MNPVIIYIIGGFLVGTVTGSWHPLAMFHKAPPTAQLTELQAKLTAQQEQAKKDAEAAEAAKVAERQKLEAQVRAAQQDNLGTATALAKVPSAHQTPEVKLASRMAQRVSLKLATAIGALPPDQQDAMIDLIDQALSDKQAEVDEANRKLSALDERFKAVTGEREELKAQIPLLTKQAQEAAQKAQETQAAVTIATNQVKEKADSLFKATQENGNLWASIKQAIFLIGGGYVVVVFLIPGLIKHMREGWAKTTLRHVSGYLSSPLLYSDAAKKIEEFKRAADNKP